MQSCCNERMRGHSDVDAHTFYTQVWSDCRSPELRVVAIVVEPWEG